MKYDEEYCKICEQLGNHIKSIRESKGISLKEVSTNTGIRQDYLQKIESGKAYHMRVNRHLFKIADALKITIRKLMKFET